MKSSNRLPQRVGIHVRWDGYVNGSVIELSLLPTTWVRTVLFNLIHTAWYRESKMYNYNHYQFRDLLLFEHYSHAL